MKNISIPAFNEADCKIDRENKNSRVYYFSNAEKSAFDSYCKLLSDAGFSKQEEYKIGDRRFAAYSKDGVGVFLNDFSSLGELCIVVEENCSYFSYSDRSLDQKVAPQITQISLEDFGMSYVIRLSDGRFIVIDGGRQLKPDADKLFECLKNGSPSQDAPVIAAWIMTHPHDDHFHCFMTFMEEYSDKVVIEKFLFNFPEADDLEHYPKLKVFETEAIPRMLEWIERTGAPVYTAHTGQRYRIGDADCEILASMDDTIHLSDNINSTSLVIRMELGGQVILWSTDARFRDIKLSDKHGAHLKADILQVPHHSFSGGGPEEQIRAYKLIDAPVCLLPNTDHIAFTWHCVFTNKASRYLFADSDTAEIITGDVQRTITLPYTPEPEAKNEIARKYLTGLENNGAVAWVFSELDTACRDDFRFTVLNMTRVPAVIWAEIFFEDPDRRLRYIKIEVEPNLFKRIDVLSDDANHDARYFNSFTLANKGLPENAPFAIRFVSNVPVVITNKNHKESYRSSAVR